MGPETLLSPAVAQVFITDELLRRAAPAPDYLQEKLAIQELARHMADRPAEVLPRLVKLAMEICGADSAGVSVLEGQEFRWFGLTGTLSVFEGATTPRGFSPCGVCLDYGGPILMAHPERAYDWIADASITVPEVLLVPLHVGGGAPLGTLWVVAPEGRHFHSGHARALTELAVFSGIALQMVQSERVLKQALAAQEMLTREMSHRVKNLFTVTDSMIRMTARSSPDKEAMTQSLLGRVAAFARAHSLVRPIADEPAAQNVALRDLIRIVLGPYPGVMLDGPPVSLDERAANSVAIILHELTTNAAKYGSLSAEGGVVRISWSHAGKVLTLTWREENGPPVTPPAKSGFGSTLVANTIASVDGAMDYDWAPGGLVVRMTLGLGAPGPVGGAAQAH